MTDAALEPPLPLQRRMEGGSDYRFFKPVHPGDTIHAVARITAITEKRSRLGPMVLVTTETTYTNQRGEVVLVATTAGIRS